MKFVEDVEHNQGGQAQRLATPSSLDMRLAELGVVGAANLFPYAKELNQHDKFGISQIYILELLPGTSVPQTIESLSADPNVIWVEPDYIAYPAENVPNDTYMPNQWGLAQIQAPAAWDVITGSPTISIAIVDSGIDETHPDLAGKLWINPGEIPTNGMDDDNNGYVDDVNGWDFVNHDNNPSDDNGHGTQVAGIAAASSNNEIGIAGVCWECTLMPVKVMQASGVANYSDIAAGVLYAAQKGARVINLSLGGYSNSSALQAAVQTAVETYGAVLVAGAGNDDVSAPFYPAAYDQVIAVVGTTTDDTKTSFSDYGTWVDISSPAVAITTTFQGGDYGATEGNSYATPFVSGLAGLLLSQNSGWSTNMVRAQIVHTSDGIDALNPGYEDLLGSGRVNAAQAVTTAAQPLLSLVNYSLEGDINVHPEPGSTVELVVTLYNEWADATNVQVALSTSDPYVTIHNSNVSLGDILAYQSNTTATPFQFSVSSSAPYSHTIAFMLNISSDGGYSDQIPVSITTSAGITYVHGTISTQTWTSDRTYIVDNNAGVGIGETLTIEPGTVIRFDGNYSMSVAGTLIADGTPQQPIIFTTNRENSAPGDWGPILFLDSSSDAFFNNEGNYQSGSILRYTHIEYGEGVNFENSAPYIAHNTLTDHVSGGISGHSSPGLIITNNEITDISGPSPGLGVSGEDFSIIGNHISNAWIGIYAMGPGEVLSNTVAKADDTGIWASGTMTVTGNRVIDSTVGMYATNGLIDHNLIANNKNYGLQIEVGSASYTVITPTVSNNTILNNVGTGVVVQGQEYLPVINNNNLISLPGALSIQYALNTPQPIDATSNWWGTTDPLLIAEVIYDGMDEFGLGIIDSSDYLTDPDQAAPAYVKSVDISPDTTLGIQTATFNVYFSRPMDQRIGPTIAFQATRRHTWDIYDKDNSPLPNNYVADIAIDIDGSIWFGVSGNEGNGAVHYDGFNWTIYDTENTGLPDDRITAIAIDEQGVKWFGLDDKGVARFDGSSWVFYDHTNSALGFGMITDATVAPDGSVWFGSQNFGAVKFDGTNWTAYNTTNSELPANHVNEIIFEPNGDAWLATEAGVAHFDGTVWEVFNADNSPLPNTNVEAMAWDQNGTLWLGSHLGDLASLSDSQWTIYDAEDLGIPNNGAATAITVDQDGDIWFASNNYLIMYDGSSWNSYRSGLWSFYGVWTTSIVVDLTGNIWTGSIESGAGEFYTGDVFAVDGPSAWLSGTFYQTVFDINTLIPRDTYSLTVENAVGLDGIVIPPNSETTFTVDYAGAIGDTTPPPTPIVTACAVESTDRLYANWMVSDPDSAITLYSYAIGLTLGGTEVINWTYTAEASFNHGNLNLTFGQPYYVAVKARNEGGLWSLAGIPDGVLAGSGMCQTNERKIFLPNILR